MTPAVKHTLTAKIMAAEHGVSIRTARRHIARGTLPTSERRTGRDGKRYPAGGIGRSPLHRPLAVARANIRRAARAAEFTAGDRAVLNDIVAEASALLNTWNDAIAALGIEPS
ncbi:MAG: hypothetical protein K8T26_02445 [Lentisphaerae bacterium]|nr:hypothetical protein [Lentisphaerota bacterium]